MAVKATIKDGRILISLPLEAARPSSTGKMNLVGGTGGWADLGVADEAGNPLRALVNVGFYANPK